ncbi:MAG: phosphatidylinositol mannoside acyltransferase [Gordonia sp. (in: high G+C Gram-positive bacteria)]
MSRLTETVTTLGYRAGWAGVRHLPDRWARAAFERAGAYVGHRNGGPDQLRRNLARVLGTPPAQVPDDLVAAAMASYARYWYEAFRLPAMNFAEAAASVLFDDEDYARYDRAYHSGRGVIFALPHAGNWDMAGVWLIQHTGKSFSTVAERLKPESLFEQFVSYRETLGFEIFALTGGEQPPFGRLADRLRAGGVVCLLAERDLTSHGVPVTFFGEPTRMPAGPARLAIETGAVLLPVQHVFLPGGTSRIITSEPVDVSVGVAGATQALADAFAVNIAAHPADWHMLQPLWESDWSARQRDRIERTG